MSTGAAPASDPVPSAVPEAGPGEPTGEIEPGPTAPDADPQKDRWLRWLVPPAVVLLAVVLVRAFLVTPFSIPSGSMEPTLEVGDRILVSRTVGPGELRRGDVIVFDASTAFGIPRGDTGLVAAVVNAIGSIVGRGSDTDYVKRVIGLPGDHVRCCAQDGRLVVNGTPVDEPYLYPGDAPSETSFEVTVPADRFWVMGDHRSESADSRAHLGAPGGGMVPAGAIIGQVWVRYWPPGRVGTLPTAPISAIPRNGL